MPVYNAKIDNTEFGENVVLDIAMRAVHEERFLNYVKELFNDKVQPVVIGSRFDKE